uniref:Uncharacterized protein n=1 Tax=Strigamia maritima TaxID=126957 RepID=T1IU26_STRMM
MTIDVKSRVRYELEITRDFRDLTVIWRVKQVVGDGISRVKGVVDLQWYLVGNMKVFWLNFENLSSLFNLAFLADVHASTSPNLMFIGKSVIYKNLSNTLEISETKFEYLNTTQNPCVTENEEIECFNKWIIDQLQTSDIECRWPFMNSTLPFCNSLLEAEQLKHIILQRQFAQKDFNCKRPCTVTLFSLQTIYGSEKQSGITIAVTFSTNTRQIVSEYFIYPFSALVSDLGGSIGLFLGVSLLSFMKFVHGTLMKI